MSRSQRSRSAYYFFVRDRLPVLQQRGLPVARVVDGFPHLTQEWALLTVEERMFYAEKAQKWNEKKSLQKAAKEMLNNPVPAGVTTEVYRVTSLLDASAISWMSDQAVLADTFYFLNVYSHGKLPSHCDQRFLPCEIGCVKYSLQEGIMADFHHFIDSEVPPRGYRYHCQAASDATHKIPISGFHLSRTCYPVVIRELLQFAQPAKGAWPRFYCKSDDRFRISWCLERMASIAGVDSPLELLTVEDLVIKLYQKKYHKEPSKTWVSRELDVVLWDFSSNTRCEWHEENDILCCALASCKKIAYCISKSLAGVYGVSLTAAHLPPKDCVSNGNTNLRRVILDAGRFQESKARGSGSDRRIHSPSGVQELVPSSCEFEISPFVQGKRVFKRDPIAAFSEFWAQKLLFVSSVKLIQLCMSWVCNGTWCRFD
ncbi:protein maelstrom homolog isoform X1 [Gallus gallus]|uniref:protein maelstrom homolog isoform X1 n=2 Tax=Gallus gallus TaxID=9031 RepID=UPI001AE5A803|nr:protein maelstrom homolog isoform X1 [Gallus gallus]